MLLDKMSRLSRVRIQNFRTIHDSGWVEFDPDICALIGENESGKTNFLKALRSFNPTYRYSYDDLCQYNLFDLRERRDSDIPIVTIEYDEEILDEIEFPNDIDVSDGDTRYDSLQITKYYDGHYEANGEIVQADSPTVTLEDYLLADPARSAIQSSIDQITEEIRTLEENEYFENERQNRLDDSDYMKCKRDISSSNFISINDYSDALENFTDVINNLRSQANNNNATNALNSLRNTLNEQKEEITSKTDLKPNAVLQSVPDFVLHESVDNIEDSLTITELRNNPGAHRTFHNLLSLTPIDLQDLESMPEGRRSSYTSSASQSITEKVDGAWRQETIDDVRISIDGNSLSVIIEDDSGSTGPPSSRSQGFQWFFSFYINFTAETDQTLRNSVLLLDDPGVYLHPTGQKDLLKKFEELSSNNQVIYNTHSPFLIDKNRLDRIKILEKRGSRGTRVTSDFQTSDGDILQPVRAAFGAEFADSLFANRKTILVEGYTDKIYLDTVSKYLRRTNRTGQALDPEEVTIISVGGANKFDYFARLLASESYDYLILLDADNEGRDVMSRLEQEEDIDDQRLVMLDDFVSDLEAYDSTIEDLFGPEFFWEVVVDTHDELPIDDEELDYNSRGIVNAIEREYGREIGGIDKTGVAKRIREIMNDRHCDDERIGETTLTRFTNVFEGIQETL